MARLITTGFEIAPNEDTVGVIRFTPDARLATGTGGVADTSTFRSGAQSIRTTAPNRSDLLFVATSVLDRTYYARSYVRFSAVTGHDVRIRTFGFANDPDTIDHLILYLNTDGTLEAVRQGGTSIGSPVAMSANVWYCLEIGYKAGSADNDYCEWRIDGVSQGSATGNFSVTANAMKCMLGASEVASSPPNIWLDDLAVNDDQGSNQNSWPGEGKVVLLEPISTGQNGSWTGGAGGTSNLWEAVNNKPPAGLAVETDASQIETGDASGDNATDEFRANLTTYTNAGIAFGNTINVLHPVINDGQEVATGTKTGSFGLQSNPSQTYLAFTYCDDVGASGIWPDNWRWHIGTPVYSPSVTLGSSPVIAVRKTDAGTRLAWVDYLGVYVDYVPTDPSGVYYLTA